MGWRAAGLRDETRLCAAHVGHPLFITADLGFAALTVNNAYQSGSLIDLGWPLGFLFATFAAVLRWTRGEAAVHKTRLGEASRWLDSAPPRPYPLVLGVLGLLFFSRVMERPHRPERIRWSWLLPPSSWSWRVNSSRYAKTSG